MQKYLDSHPDRPSELKEAADVLARGGAAGSAIFPPLKDDNEEKATERAAGIKKIDQAYRDYFKSKGIQALLVPVSAMEPKNTESWTPDSAPLSGKDLLEILHFGAFGCYLSIPSITLPTAVKARQCGNGSLPISVMLLGIDDQELISVALALEGLLKQPF